MQYIVIVMVYCDRMIVRVVCVGLYSKQLMIEVEIDDGGIVSLNFFVEEEMSFFDCVYFGKLLGRWFLI